MAFRKPIQPVIYTADFHDGAVHVPVESVLDAPPATGELRLIAPAGYLLTTLVNKTPQPEQTLTYVRQPNGSYVAHGLVTLLTPSGETPVGAVRLEDPLGETLQLPIVADQTVAASAGQPVLTVSTERVTFDKTPIGEESYAILRISQQHADTPVDVAVTNAIGQDSDEWARFSIATGVRELIFTTGLNFVPAPGGTYLHLRYVPNRPGRHSARLLIETPFETKSVSLAGQTTGLLPLAGSLPQRRLVPPSAPRPSQPQPEPVDSDAAGNPRWLRWSALLLAGGLSLAYAGYVYRCRLFPSLCGSASASISAPTPDRSVRPEPSASTTDVPTPTRPAETKPDVAAPLASSPAVLSRRSRAHTDAPVVNPVVLANQAAASARDRSRPKPVEPAENQPNQPGKRRPANVAVTPTRTRPTDPASAALTGSTPTERPAKRRTVPTVPASPPTGESDLEQELNRKNNP